MVPQYASTTTTMGFAAPSSAPANGADDLMARTQRILQAARAVQMSADARPMMMNFPVPASVAPMPTPVMQLQMQKQVQVHKQKQQPAPVVTKPQMTAPSSSLPLSALTVARQPPQQQRRVSIEPVHGAKRRRASWLAMLSKTDAAVTKSAVGAAEQQPQQPQQPPAKKARTEQPSTKKQQPKKKLPTAKATKATACKSATKAPKDDKPKRPLSAYNLFFRHERAVILMHEAQNPATSKDELLGNAVPVNRLPTRTVAEHRAAVRSVLNDNPFHQDRKTRAHRKSHGKIGFTDLVKLVAARWKRADKETKALYDVLSAEEKDKYTVQYEAWRSRQPLDVLARLDAGSKRGGKKSPSPVPTKSIQTIGGGAGVGKPLKKVSPPTKKAILAKAQAAVAADISCFAPLPNLYTSSAAAVHQPISDHESHGNDDFALLSDDELSAEEMDDLFPMPELAAAAGGMVMGGVPTVSGGFEPAPLHGMAMGGMEAFPLDDSLVSFLTAFD